MLAEGGRAHVIEWWKLASPLCNTIGRAPSNASISSALRTPCAAVMSVVSPVTGLRSHLCDLGT